ncbi:hypothetical protein GCM10007036_31430 [Alsobacter metallidurans]|uniref:Uncharacterized protein n=1 Tax=Alsobacter metallidurans TaxID=340221 RepID=A0A917I886_9HYPH|nr:hypothetical protein [Alsobacter metallidurans]GGH24777.1 hypothetical protein GCM10007036_31430 [Alsobacter metallidurans]
MELKMRRRTGKGAWYAVVQVWERVSAGEMREIDSVSERCPTKTAAVEKARELLKANADRLSDYIEVTAEILSELEWSA